MKALGEVQVPQMAVWLAALAILATGKVWAGCRAALKSEIVRSLFSTCSQISMQFSLPLNMRLLY